MARCYRRPTREYLGTGDAEDSIKGRVRLMILCKVGQVFLVFLFCMTCLLDFLVLFWTGGNDSRLLSVDTRSVKHKEPTMFQDLAYILLRDNLLLFSDINAWAILL